MDPWLVAGLGNPGDRYAATRHNAGAMVVDAMASASGERFRKARFVPVETAELTIEGRKVWLAKSLRFMNESGPSYASIAKKHEVPPDHVIAVHDEIDLPFGALKVKIGGSTAGHNGLKSLQQALGTPPILPQPGPGGAQQPRPRRHGPCCSRSPSARSQTSRS